MIYVTYLTLLVWLLYYTLYEVSLHHTNKKVKSEGKTVVPDLLVLSAIRYKCVWIAFILLAIIVTIGNLLVNSYTWWYILGINLIVLTFYPVLIYIVFYIVSKHLIAKAKRVELKNKLKDNE